MDNDGKPEPIQTERTGRKTVRIAPLSNAELVWGDEDRGMENLREVLTDERWERGL